MKLSLQTLKKITVHKKKRLGRGTGSGAGEKSGRGTTRHQTARENIPLHFEGGQGRMVKRFPLLRGKGKNNSARPVEISIRLSKLNIFEDGAVVNLSSLRKIGIIKTKSKKLRARIVGGGTLSKKLDIQLPISESVKKELDIK